MGKSSSLVLNKVSEQFPAPFKKSFYFLPISLSLITLLFIFIYDITTTVDVTHNLPQTDPYLLDRSLPTDNIPFDQNSENGDDLVADPSRLSASARANKWLGNLFGISNGNYTNNIEAYHDEDIFLEDYKQMNKSLKIYVYPYPQDHPFKQVFEPFESDPVGNFASEHYFKKALMKSHFITEDPDEADFFYMPFSIALIRDDHRLDIAGISVFVKSYIQNITNIYPYWNRTGGADHFYFACHSKGRFAFDKAFVAKLNVIQLLCSSNLYISSYVAHKDAPVPQVWPRLDAPPIPNLLTRERKQLGFFSGGINSRTRVYLLKVWDNDTEIFTHHGRLPTPYSEQLLGSKFCIHARGYEVNSARIADAIYYGCVPVILSNHYDLPFTDILNWKSFSVIVNERDIPILKRILQGISSEEYAMLQSNVIKVRKHFQWHTPPTDFDALHMSLYELWQRRSVVKVKS
ncbi:Exostosin-like protein [Corchorus olitorius]|uniref:Exostosin-like protein n=1 Tax=Corchorus olitorius TaxID=93759 RepID=A0A1R3HP10_9ROSI|nr:Exostosin-like protein [Corchorus olitorius]